MKKHIITPTRHPAIYAIKTLSISDLIGKGLENNISGSKNSDSFTSKSKSPESIFEVYSRLKI